MKFCYLDESGTGGQAVAVMVGIIVDSTRMHLTKEHWSALLLDLSDIVGKEIAEFHAHKFYKGDGIWKGLSGDVRSSLIGAIIQWMKERKHKIVYSAIDTEKFKLEAPKLVEFNDLSLWRCLGLHSSLAIQRSHQRESKNKGNTVLIFDEAVKEKQKFTRILLEPPAWTDDYYQRKKSQAALDQLIDVPHFVDSRHVGLVQVADVYAFVLRRYFELKSGLETEKYIGEAAKLAGWAEDILAQSIGSSHIFPSKGSSVSANLFKRVAPACCL